MPLSGFWAKRASLPYLYGLASSGWLLQELLVPELQGQRLDLRQIALNDFRWFDGSPD